MFKHFARRPFFHDSPGIGNCNAIRHLRDNAKIVRDEKQRKLKLAAQATVFLWQPSVRQDQGRPSAGGLVDSFRSLVEPLYIVPLYLLAIAGLFVVPLRFRALAVSFLLYETAEAWVFAGATRYRIAWDFLLSLLAAAAITRVPWSRLARPSRSSR